jgi:CubicO group peptidase (beta-lactamase class C family)
MLLDWVLETCLEARLDRALEQRLWNPLGLARTGFVDLDGALDPADRCAATEDCVWRGRLLVGEVHDQNTAAMGGVSGQAGLFSTAGEVHRILRALHRAFRGETSGPFRPDTVRRFWQPGGVPDSSFRLGWDGPSASGYTSAGRRIGPDAVGHLGFTGCSIWLSPPAGYWTILLTNRIHPTVENRRIQAFRPRLHDLVAAELRR